MNTHSPMSAARAVASDPAAKPDWARSRREAEADRRAREGLPPRRRWWPWLALAVLVIAGLAAYQFRDQIPGLGAASAAPTGAAGEGRPPEAASDAAAAPIQINRSEWAVVEPQTLRRTVKVIGTLQPVRRADLSSETQGQVEAVRARPGDRVTAGEVLVQVDVERLTLELDLARSNTDATRAELALAEQQLERSAALVERGVAASSTLDEAQSSVAGLRAGLAALDDQVAVAELALEGAAVRAPFAGVVASRSVEPGNVVSAGTPLLSIVDLSEVEMLASAPVAAGPQIRPGQVVEVEVDGVEGRSFAGEVVRVAPVAEEGTRTLTVYVMIDNADGTLLGGMFGTGRIVVAEARDAVAIPTAALRADDAGDHVLVIEEGTLVRRAVELGEAWEGGVTQVTGGLAPGDQVIVVPLSDLAGGEAVELVEF